MPVLKQLLADYLLRITESSICLIKDKYQSFRNLDCIVEMLQMYIKPKGYSF